MAKVPTPKAIDRNVLGGAKKATSVKGPHGGGTEYNQLKPSKGFAIQTVKGHPQKANIKK